MWDFDHVSKAIAAALDPVGEGISVFAVSPASFNPPALVVGRPETVELDNPAFSVDLVNLAVLAFVGIGEDQQLGELLRRARDTLAADRSLGGQVRTCRTIRFRNWAIMNISGADYLKAELLLEVWA